MAMHQQVIQLPTPVHTSEREDLELVVRYLGLPQSSTEIQQITGLSKSAISEILNDQRVRDTRQRRHLAIVAELIRQLRASRKAVTGSAERGKSALGWLHSARVATSRGTRTPLEVLSDTHLALEAIGDTWR